jgi:hypothetical protein
MKVATIEPSKLAKTGQQYLDLLGSQADWIARSADDLKQIRAAGDGPLAKLPEKDFYSFLESLEFKRGGVAHGYYKPLMASLTLTEIFEVFERFGLSREYTVRTLEAKCSGGSCEFEFWSFCASNCAPQTERG